MQKIIICRGIFCHRFLEILRKIAKENRDLELVSANLEALLLWVVKLK